MTKIKSLSLLSTANMQIQETGISRMDLLINRGRIAVGMKESKQIIFKGLGAVIENPPALDGYIPARPSRMFLETGEWFDVRRRVYNNSNNTTITGQVFWTGSREMRFKIVGDSNDGRPDTFQIGDMMIAYDEDDNFIGVDVTDEFFDSNGGDVVGRVFEAVRNNKMFMTKKEDWFMLMLTVKTIKGFDSMWSIRQYSDQNNTKS